MMIIINKSLEKDYDKACGHRQKVLSSVSTYTAMYPWPGTAIFGTSTLLPNFSVLEEYSFIEDTPI
jgi:hypothetical protein